MAKRWTQEEDELLLKLRSEGFAAREIALRVHRTYSATRMRLSQLAPDNLSRKWTEEEKLQAIQLKESGHTTKSIAKKLGRTPGAISTFLSRNWHNDPSLTIPGKNSA